MFSALSCVLFQHLSKSNNLLPVVLVLWLSQCSPHAFPICYHRWAQLLEHQWNCSEAEGEVGKQVKRPGTATDLLINCYSYVRHRDLSFCFTPFLLLMKRRREEKATSCHLFGAVGGILTVQFTELLLRRLSRIACAADIGTFCSGCSAKPTPDKLHMLKCFSKGYFSHVCVL